MKTLHLATLATLLLVAGCSDSNDADPATSSQSHWLISCDADAACGDGLSCLCGVCTVTCEDGDACGGPDGNRCAGTDERPEGICDDEPTQICLPECTPPSNPDEVDTCAVDDLVCVKGSCVPPNLQPECGAFDQCAPGYEQIEHLDENGCLFFECNPRELACGDLTCTWPMQYCDVFTPGQPEEETSYTCEALPPECGPDPSCNCMAEQFPSKECTEDESGVTMRLNAP